jgi:DNA-binding PadR family transcriptional regulator
MALNILTSLELFLLALVDGGWNTPYKLKADAGISVGAALPALKRLQERRLVQRAESAARNKQEFEVTAAGKKALTTETKRLLREYQKTPPNDIESVLRMVVLAFAGKRRGIAVSVLKSTGESKRRVAKFRAEEASQVTSTDLAALYRRMVQACEAARAGAEAEVMVSLAGQFKRIKTS